MAEPRIPKPGELRAFLEMAASASQSLEIVAEMLERVPFGLALYDASDENFRIVYANAAAGQFMEISPEAAVGAALVTAFPSALSNGTIEVFKTVRATGQSKHYREMTLGPVTSGSSRRSWNYDVYPITDSAMRVTHVLGVGHDVTELVVARERVQQAANFGLSLLLEISRLAETAATIEEFFGGVSKTIAGLLGCAVAGFALYDPESETLGLQRDGHGLSAASARRLRDIPCRRSENDLASRIVFESHALRGEISLLSADPDFQPYRELLEAIAQRDVLAVAWRAGDERLGLVGALDSQRSGGFTDEDILVLRTAGRATGLVYQRWRAEQELAARADELSSLERSKSDFLNLASHELRGPLTVVSGYLSMIKDGSISIDTPGVLDTMESKVRDIESMVALMLAAARLEDSQLELKRQASDLRDVVAAAAEATLFVRRPGQKLALETAETPVPVDIDRARVGTILANLLTNAYRYSPAPSLVTCSVSTEGAEAVVRVADEGPGISAENLAKLFQRFGRLDTLESMQVPGTGLGLFISRETARLHGGDVTVSSTVGQGSTFTLRLPLQR